MPFLCPLPCRAVVGNDCFEFKVIHGNDHSYQVTYGFGFKASVGTYFKSFSAGVNSFFAGYIGVQGGYI